MKDLVKNLKAENQLSKDQFDILIQLYCITAYSQYETQCDFQGKIIHCDCGYVCDFLDQILTNTLPLWSDIKKCARDQENNL